LYSVWLHCSWCNQLAGWPVLCRKLQPSIRMHLQPSCVCVDLDWIFSTVS